MTEFWVCIYLDLLAEYTHTLFVLLGKINIKFPFEVEKKNKLQYVIANLTVHMTTYDSTTPTYVTTATTLMTFFRFINCC